MSTPDFIRSRLDQTIDLRHSLAVLAARLPWAAIDAALAPKRAHLGEACQGVVGDDLAGAFESEFSGGNSPAERPRLPIRLMVSLLKLKNSFNLSDDALVERWAENVRWQFFMGMKYYESCLPCNATQIGRFRRLLGEDGLEQLLKATIECPVQIRAERPADLERGTRRQHSATQGPRAFRGQPAVRDRAPRSDWCRKAPRLCSRQANQAPAQDRQAPAHDSRRGDSRGAAQAGYLLNCGYRRRRPGGRTRQCEGTGRTRNVAGACRVHPHPAARHQEQAQGAARPRGGMHLLVSWPTTLMSSASRSVSWSPTSRA